MVIAIFSEYNLNTSKHLKKAFLLYTNGTSCKRNNKVKMEINNIRKGMNLTRTDFTLPQNHVFNVTPDWLLGFSEGDGSFYSESNKNTLYFGIKQKGNEKFLLGIILNLTGFDNNGIRIDKKEKGMFLLTINNLNIIEFRIIPMFDNITWYSKKYLYYYDWKLIIKKEDIIILLKVNLY